MINTTLLQLQSNTIQWMQYKPTFRKREVNVAKEKVEPTPYGFKYVFVPDFLKFVLLADFLKSG